VLGQGLGLTVTGIVLGLLGAFALTRVMKGMLFEVSATDPKACLGVSLLFILIALAASYVPAQRPCGSIR
jgi:putative ABC transport system permease protein